MSSVDRSTATNDDRPLRLSRLARAMSWLPALITLGPAGFYAVFVLAPWLVYFAGHGTGPCTIDLGCAGPGQVSALVFPGAQWNPLNWPLAAAVIFSYLIVVTGPATTLALGALTVAGATVRLFEHRAITLVGGGLMLALGVFQLTPTGTMITIWLAD